MNQFPSKEMKLVVKRRKERTRKKAAKKGKRKRKVFQSNSFKRLCSELILTCSTAEKEPEPEPPPEEPEIIYVPVGCNAES